MNLMARYDDAYLTARTLDSTGQLVKVAGFVLGGLIAMVGFGVASKNGVGSAALGGLILGALVALPFWVLGVLVASQGQILKATLDAAVNSSPLLTHDEIRQILKQTGAQQQTQHPPGAKSTCDKCGKAFPSHFYLESVDNQYLCEGCRQAT
jgi:hypothetical protein